VLDALPAPPHNRVMPNDDLDPRVQALEERMATQAGLRASQDRDLSDLQQDARSTKHLVQALALTQSEHTSQLARIERTLKSNSEVLGALVVENVERFAALDARLGGMDARFDGMDARLDGMDARLDGMDARFDGMDARFDGMDARFDGMDARFDGTDARFDHHTALLSEILVKIDGLGPATS
jgi:chromosome segregation ATPase